VQAIVLDEITISHVKKTSSFDFARVSQLFEPLSVITQNEILGKLEASHSLRTLASTAARGLGPQNTHIESIQCSASPTTTKIQINQCHRPALQAAYPEFQTSSSKQLSFDVKLEQLEQPQRVYFEAMRRKRNPLIREISLGAIMMGGLGFQPWKRSSSSESNFSTKCRLVRPLY